MQTQAASAAESAAVATTSVGFPQVGAQPILMMDPNQVPNGTNSLALVPSNMSSTVPAKVIYHANYVFFITFSRPIQTRDLLMLILSLVNLFLRR